MKISVFSATLFFSLLLSGESFFSSDLHAAEHVLTATFESDTINPATANYIDAVIERAENENAVCVILKMDTPGGLLSSTRTIVKRILASRIPVVVYVAPSGSRAGSAGVFITYASHIAAMAPSTHIGAAHPVRMGEERKQGPSLLEWVKNLFSEDSRKEEPSESNGDGGSSPDVNPMNEKVLNDAVVFIRTLAEKRGRNADWGIKSVTESATLTEVEAQQNGVVEIIAESIPELLNKLDGRTVTVQGEPYELKTEDANVEHAGMNFRDRLLNILANPNLSYMLLMLGFYGLLFEVTHPGLGVPGALGTIFIVLALFGMQALPTNYAGLGLILLGILLVGVEVLVPGFGLPALGGIACLFLGSLFLFESTTELMSLSLGLIFGFVAATTVITMMLIRAVVEAHRKKPGGGMEGMIGVRAEALRAFDESGHGKVYAHGEIWDAGSEDRVEAGDKVIVTGYEHMILQVKKENS